MHQSSYKQMTRFVAEYLDASQPLSILDVGSCDVNGTYRALFDSPTWEYAGGDITPGRNVDIVFQEPYSWGIPDARFDVVVSGQCLEHVEDVQAWMREVARVTKPGGTVCLITVWQWNEHRYPIDCWRVLPDGMRWLMQTVGGLDVIQSFTSGADCVGIGRRPQS